MDHILPQYKPPDPTTWVYMSSLLTIAIYFKFNRVWSLRNFDLLGLIAMSPGVLLVSQGGQSEALGYAWLFIMGGVFLLRLLIDPMMVRRPLLEPNLSTGGLTFSAIALSVFLVVNILTRDLTESDLEGPRRLEAALSRADSSSDESVRRLGPGYVWLHWLPSVATRALPASDEQVSEAASVYAERAATTRAMAICSHFAIILGLIVIGVRHFDNVRTGIAATMLYLLLPYTAEMTGHVYHALPAALLVWAVVAYRRPLISGVLIGLATGTTYYPLFLLPLWIAFYWHRGLIRFLVGVGSMLAALVAALALTSPDSASFFAQVKLMFGWTVLAPQDVRGFWSGADWKLPYRIPVMVGFMAMSMGFALWPSQKNLGTLLSCSAAVMLGTQFWHAQQGGLYMNWYLPLLLLTIFRPNLEDRVAISTLGEGWWIRRRSALRVRAA